MQKRLPELLTNREPVGFYEAVWHGRNPTHMIMIKLPIYTGLRNAELARVSRQDADLDHCQLRVVQGESRDRKTGLSASVSASYHHFSDPQSDHQPKLVSERVGAFFELNRRASQRTSQKLNPKNADQLLTAAGSVDPRIFVTASA
jgi:integrase